MDFLHLHAGDDDDGRRLDRIMRRYLPGAALSSLYKSLRSGLIKVNGRPCDGSRRIHSGDDIAVAAFLCTAGGGSVHAAANGANNVAGAQKGSARSAAPAYSDSSKRTHTAADGANNAAGAQSGSARNAAPAYSDSGKRKHAADGANNATSAQNGSVRNAASAYADSGKRKHESADSASNGTAAQPRSARTPAPLAAEAVLFRNEHLLAVNKPYDMPVQPSARGSTALTELVAADYALRHTSAASISFRAAPLHRLDRKTTGVLVCSQSLLGAQWFSAALQSHRLEKHYLALLCGRLPARCTWCDAISKHGTPARAFHTVSVTAAAPADASAEGRAKPAVTDAAPLAYGRFRGSDVTLAQLAIHTGRTHQIRSQAARHGFPLLGDSAYGAPPLQDGHIFLHAAELRLPAQNPCGAPALIRAELPDEFKKMLSAILIKWDGRLIL